MIKAVRGQAVQAGGCLVGGLLYSGRWPSRPGGTHLTYAGRPSRATGDFTGPTALRSAISRQISKWANFSAGVSNNLRRLTVKLWPDFEDARVCATGDVNHLGKIASAPSSRFTGQADTVGVACEDSGASSDGNRCVSQPDELIRAKERLDRSGAKQCSTNCIRFPIRLAYQNFTPLLSVPPRHRALIGNSSQYVKQFVAHPGPFPLCQAEKGKGQLDSFI